MEVWAFSVTPSRTKAVMIGYGRMAFAKRRQSRKKQQACQGKYT
jgi:hypothetical protein